VIAQALWLSGDPRTTTTAHCFGCASSTSSDGRCTCQDEYVYEQTITNWGPTDEEIVQARVEKARARAAHNRHCKTGWRLPAVGPVPTGVKPPIRAQNNQGYKRP